MFFSGRRVSKRVVDAEAVEKQREALKRKQDILSQRWEKEVTCLWHYQGSASLIHLYSVVAL